MLLTETEITKAFREVDLTPEQVTAMAIRVENLLQESLESEKKLLTESITERVKADLEDKTSEYLEYVINEWCIENTENLNASVKTELTEAFVGDLKNLFLEHQVDVPESDNDMLEEANDIIANIELDYETKVEENINLINESSDIKKRLLISEMLNENSDLTIADGDTLYESTKTLKVVTPEDEEKFKSVSKLLLTEAKQNKQNTDTLMVEGNQYVGNSTVEQDVRSMVLDLL